MKRTTRKVWACIVVLTIAMSVLSSALATNYPSKSFKLPQVRHRPTAQPTAEAPGADPTGTPNAVATAEASVEPTEIPAETAVPERIVASAVVVLADAGSSLNVRAEGRADAACVATLRHGDEVSVYGAENGWTHILTAGGVEGYVSSDYLREIIPTAEPTMEPTTEPTMEPTVEPTMELTVEPTMELTVEPTMEPSVEPTMEPSVEPTAESTEEPTVEPMAEAIEEPTVEPTAEPTVEPTAEPTEELTVEPTAEATEEPIVEPTAEPTMEPAEELKYSFERDEHGELILDASGNPIAIIPEGMTERPTRYRRDSSGELILDENGDPIVVATVPVDAEIVSQEEDEQKRVVTIYVSGGADGIALGREVTLIAELEGFDDVACTLQWENSADGISWNAVEGGNAARYTYMLTEEVNNYYWRMTVMTEEAEEQSSAPRAESEDDAAGAIDEDAAV